MLYEKSVTRLQARERGSGSPPCPCDGWDFRLGGTGPTRRGGSHQLGGFGHGQGVHLFMKCSQSFNLYLRNRFVAITSKDFQIHVEYVFR